MFLATRNLEGRCKVTRRGSRHGLPCLTLLQVLTCFLIQGYLFGLLSAFLSALAAVYTEWVMKRNNDSLYWQASFVLGCCAPSP